MMLFTQELGKHVKRLESLIMHTFQEREEQLKNL
jgi:hypothetical protein